MTTSINKAIDMGTKILPPVAGSTVNLGTIGTTQVTTTTTTTQNAGVGFEGAGLGIGMGAEGYGATSVHMGETQVQSGGVEGSAFAGQQALGYGTTSIERGQSAIGLGGAQYGGIEGSAFAGQQALGYGTTSIEHGQSATTSNIGGNQVINTITPSYLPNAFTSTQPGEIVENDQQINA